MTRGLSPANKFNVDFKDAPWTDLPTDGDQLQTGLSHGATVSRLGLVLADELDRDQWLEVGFSLIALEANVQWAIGDWWAYGHHKYGERTAAFLKTKKFPYEFGTLMNLGSVARKIPTSLRNEALTWSHHAAVAPLNGDKQKEKWLKKAVREDWSVKKLRQQVYDKEKIDLGRDPARWGTSQIRRYTELALRARQQVSWSDSPEFDRVGDDAIHDLVSNVSITVVAWREFYKDVKAYQEKRLAAGDSFKPRPLEDDQQATLQAAE